jgi:hypothetical protein
MRSRKRFHAARRRFLVLDVRLRIRVDDLQEFFLRALVAADADDAGAGGRSLATSRAYIAGRSLRIARSPLPPKKTRSKSESAMGV